MQGITEVPQASPGTAEAHPRTLAAWTYENEELHRLEYERLLLDSWQLACHVGDLPQPGDFLVFELQRDAVLLLRDEAGTIRAFHNVCRHRGTRLCDGAGRLQTGITCPYHGWHYDLQGRLQKVPGEAAGFGVVERARHSLVPVRHEVFLGFVFVRLAGDGPSVAETWGAMAELLAPYRIETMRPCGGIGTWTWEADWKVAIDNNLENYHIAMGHPGYHRLLEAEAGDRANDQGISYSITRLRERPSRNWVERSYQELAPRALAAFPPERQRRWLFFAAMPNLGLDVYPDSLDFFQVLPLAPGRCQIRAGVYAPPEDSRELRVLRYLNARINGQATREDQALSERVQRGLRSCAYRDGPLSRFEDSVKFFQDLVRERIPAAALAEAPPPGQLRAVDTALRAAAPG